MGERRTPIRAFAQARLVACRLPRATLDGAMQPKRTLGFSAGMISQSMLSQPAWYQCSSVPWCRRRGWIFFLENSRGIRSRRVFSSRTSRRRRANLPALVVLCWGSHSCGSPPRACACWPRSCVWCMRVNAHAEIRGGRGRRASLAAKAADSMLAGTCAWPCIALSLTCSLVRQERLNRCETGRLRRGPRA